MKCSFCNKELSPNDRYVTGLDMSTILCSDCLCLLHTNYKENVVNIYNSNKSNFCGILNGQESDSNSATNDLTPSQIKSELDKYIIGQEDAKKDICTAIYNHYKRINQGDDDNIEIEKSNICIIGGTGTGKTEIARSIAKMLNVPFAICDATTITQSGYVGEDIESIITRLLQNCDYDVEKAQHGIIVLDEADKLHKTSNNNSITRDVSGEGVQQGLLKMLEGTDALVPPQGGRKHPEQKLIKVNTKNILFILSGAFVGLEDIIKERLKEEQKGDKNAPKIGFGAINNTYYNFSTEKSNNKNNNKSNNKSNNNQQENTDILASCQPDDIIKFGMIPEIVGRIPIITHTLPLDKVALKHILTEPLNAITKQYIKLLSYSNVELTFTPNAIDTIAAHAEKLGTGARALRTCIEKVMKDVMFYAPDEGKKSKEPYKLKIGKKEVENKLGKIESENATKNNVNIYNSNKSNFNGKNKRSNSTKSKSVITGFAI